MVEGAIGERLKSEERWEADTYTNNYVSPIIEMSIIMYNGDIEKSHLTDGSGGTLN